MAPIEQLSSEEFSRAVRINVVYGPRCEVEQFAVARIGRIWYATSVQFGYAYTRPQLIEKYRNVRATYTISPRD